MPFRSTEPDTDTVTPSLSDTVNPSRSLTNLFSVSGYHLPLPHSNPPESSRFEGRLENNEDESVSGRVEKEEEVADGRSEASVRL